MNQGVRKGSLYALLGQGAASILLFLFQMLAGRWLGVELYGLLNVLYSAIFIVTVVIIAGVNQGLIRYIAFFEAKNDNKSVIQSIETSFMIYLLFLLTIVLLSIIFKDFIVQRLFNGETIMLMQYFIGICCLSLFRFYNGMLQGYRKFHIFSFGFGFKEFTMLIILVILIKFLNLSVPEVGWSIVLAPLFAILYILPSAKDLYNPLKWKRIEKLNLHIVRFILIAGIISLMNQWIIRIGPLILKLIGGDTADYYAGLFSAIIMPLNLVRTVVISLLVGLFPNLSRAYSLKDENLIRRYILKSFGLVGLLIILIIPVYYYFGSNIVRLLFGAEFVALRSDTTLLSIVISLSLLGILLSKILMARGTPKYSAFSFLIGILGLLGILFYADLPPMKLVIISLLVCNFLYTFIQAVYLLIVKFQSYLKKQTI